MKILNYGSLNIDYVYEVEHFVQPGETLAATHYEVFCGGKGLNQSIALKRAGLEVYQAGTIGIDGKILIDRLQQFAVNCDYLVPVKQANGHAIIQVNNQGQNSIILHGGSNQMINRQQIDETLRHFNSGDYLIIQNEINELSYLINQAYIKGMIIFFNPSPFQQSILELPLNKIDYFFVNEVEGFAFTQCHDPIMIGTQMLESYNDTKIILTLGEKGSMYFAKNETLTQPVIPTNVVDTTAAGDTFMGYFIASLYQDKSIQQALYTAALAASITVSRKGASDSIPMMVELD